MKSPQRTSPGSREVRNAPPRKPAEVSMNPALDIFSLSSGSEHSPDGKADAAYDSERLYDLKENFDRHTGYPTLQLC